MVSTSGPSYAESLARGSPEPVFSVTPSGRVLSWTRRAELAYGYTRGEAIGRQLLALVVPPESVDELQRGLGLAFSTGGARVTGACRRKDGTTFQPIPMRLERRGEGADAQIVFFAGREAADAQQIILQTIREEAPRVVVERAAPAPDIVQVALARIRDATAADATALLLANDDGTLAPSATSSPSEAKDVPVGRGFAALLSGAVGFMVDHSDEGAPSPYRAVLGVTVFVDARPIGVLEAVYHRAVAVAEHDVRLLQLSADVLAAALGRSALPEPGLAEREDLRLEIDKVLAASFAPTVMLQRVAQALVPRFVDWCAVDLIESASPPRRVAAAHREPGRENAIMTIGPGDETAQTPGSTQRVLRSAQAVIEREPTPIPEPRADESARVRILRDVGHGAHLILPMLGRTRLLGALTLVRAHGRRFTDADVAWSQDLARRIALEVENNVLIDHFQRLNETARHATERARILQGLSSALSEALTPGQVTEEAIQQARRAMGACGGAIAMMSDDHSMFEVAALVGDAEPLSNAMLRFPVHATLPLADAARSGDIVILESVLSGAPRYPYLAHGARRAQGALCAVPLLVDGRTVGALGLCFPERRVFSADDLDFMRNLARHAADALERARLYNAERSARAQADAEARRSAFLADASRVLSSSFDYRATLEAAARLTVPLYADWCVVYLKEKDGSVRTVTAVHADPRKANLARELLWRPAPNPDEPGGVGKVLRSGKPEVFDDIPPHMLDALVTDAETRRIVGELGMRSQVILPLAARDRVLGGIALCSGAHRRLQPPELQLVEELARRAALAVDNARLYHEVEDAYRRKEESMHALRESEERYRLLVDGVTDHAIFMLDAQGRVQSWNPGAARLIGYEEDIVGKSFHLLFTPEDIAARRPERDIEEALAHGRCEDEGWRVRKDGTRYWANVVVTALRDEKGNVKGFAKLHRDMTERKRAREELDNARQRVAQHEKLSTMGTLVSGVAHEIRTPLTAIANSLHLMRFQLDRGKLDADALRRHTGLALEGVDRINSLVQDLRRFKRVDTSGRAATSLDGVVSEALTLFRAAHRGLVDVAADLRPTPACEVDRAQMQQVVLNLLQNASEAMPHGGKIELQTGEGPDGTALIRVRDRGIGMPTEVKARMFEEFFTTKPEGTGLGLSIVRRIMELHNGRIECDSAPGQGTMFTLHLPAARTVLAAR